MASQVPAQDIDPTNYSDQLKSVYSSRKSSQAQYHPTLTTQTPHPSLVRSRSVSEHHPHRSTISLASTFSDQSSNSAPSSRSSRALSSSGQSSAPDEEGEELSPTHPLSQMGAGRFWAHGERRQSRFSLQQARERMRLPKDLRWSEPNKPRQARTPPCSHDRDRVAEAREWIENQCATAGFGDLDLGRPPSPPLSSKKSSISLAPSAMTQTTADSNSNPDVSPSAEDLQTRIDALSERIADRERRIKTRQQLQRLQAEEEAHNHQAPSIDVILEKTVYQPPQHNLVEPDSRSATNLGVLEEVDDKDELPAYSDPNGVSVIDYKNYTPPPPPHPAFSAYHLLEPGQSEGIDRSRADSLTPKPHSQTFEEPATTPVVRLNEETNVPREVGGSELLNRPILHQRTASAPGDRPPQIISEFQNGGRGRSVSIDTRTTSPSPYSPVSSTGTAWDTSTAATTPADDLKNNFLSVNSAKSPPPPAVSAPTTPMIYCSDPIALSSDEYPFEDSSLFSDLESLAGAYRIKPKSSMSNLQQGLSHASQAPMPVRNFTTKGKRDSYMAGQAPIPALPLRPGQK